MPACHKQIYSYYRNVQELKSGTKVLVENTQQKERRGGKFDDKYKGPHKIDKSLGKGVYTLTNMDGKVLKTKHNVVCLIILAYNIV